MKTNICWMSSVASRPYTTACKNWNRSTAKLPSKYRSSSLGSAAISHRLRRHSKARKSQSGPISRIWRYRSHKILASSSGCSGLKAANKSKREGSSCSPLQLERQAIPGNKRSQCKVPVKKALKWSKKRVMISSSSGVESLRWTCRMKPSTICEKLINLLFNLISHNRCFTATVK